MRKIGKTELERWAERVHMLLEGEDAIVTWNAYVPDPDNPRRKRQVDVTITRDGVITHVECRAHQAVQDVKWIEELMGRRESLGAHSMIAVSASGFTEGATRKAKRYGILLRTLSSLSDEEIRSWSNRIEVSMEWLKVHRLQVEFVFSPMAKWYVTYDLLEAMIREGAFVRALLDKIKDGLDANLEAGIPVSGILSGGVSVDVAGWNAHSIAGQFEVEIFSEELTIPAVMSYTVVDDGAADVQATIGRSNRQGMEVVRSKDTVNMILDLSSVEAPENCYMIGPRMKSDRVIMLHTIQLVEKVWPPTTLEKIVLGMRFQNRLTFQEEEGMPRS